MRDKQAMIERIAPRWYELDIHNRALTVHQTHSENTRQKGAQKMTDSVGKNSSGRFITCVLNTCC